MTSIVRIKRRLSQEPAEALLLATKRMRVEDSLAVKPHGVEENIFRFCGTIENEEENMTNIAKLVEKGKLTSHRQPTKSFRCYQSRKHMEPTTPVSEKKYKVLSKKRDLDTADSWQIYDFILEEHQQNEIATCNGVPLVVEKCEIVKDESKCVFDLYYCEEGTFDDGYIDRLMSVQPYYHHPGEQEESDDEDTDDSNDESNWRNDYPDTDEDDEGDEDIVGKMCGMYLCNEDQFSTSDDDDGLYRKDHYFPRFDAYEEYKNRVTRDLLLNNTESDSEDDDKEEFLECMS